jgi:hypothetical protein
MLFCTPPETCQNSQRRQIPEFSKGVEKHLLTTYSFNEIEQMEAIINLAAKVGYGGREQVRKNLYGFRVYVDR